MNKISKIITILGIIFIIILIAAISLIISYYSHYYKKEMKVIAIENEIVKFEDDFLNIWEWELEESDSFTVGQTYTVKLFDCNTETPYDDEITDIS